MAPEFDKDYWESHWQQAARRPASGTAEGPSGSNGIAVNPYLAAELSGLAPGTGLDAGCGEGAEAMWLAARGWHVTAVDISAEVLSHASARAASVGGASVGGASVGGASEGGASEGGASEGGAPEGGASGNGAGSIQWLEADLGTWEPASQFDLVTTHYAHPSIGQLPFYERITDWVGLGGTLLIVGHLHTLHSPDAAHEHRHHGHERSGDGGGHGRGGGAHGENHSVSHIEEASETAADITALLDSARWEIISAYETTRTTSDRTDREIQLDDVVVRATRRL